MSDTHKTKQQLIEELQTLRAQVQTDGQTNASEQSLLEIVANISDIILSHTNLDGLLDALTHEVISTNLFRSLTIILVNKPKNCIEIRRRIKPKEAINRQTFVLPIETQNIAGVVARTNKMEVIEGWDDRFAFDTNVNKAEHGQMHEDKISYFIPIAHNNEVIAILATGSIIKKKQQTLNHIAMLQPIMGQLAVAIRYAQIHEQLQHQTHLLEAQVKTQQQDIEEKSQSLNAFQTIDHTLLNTLDIDQLLEAVLEHILTTKYFRSLVVFLVDYPKQTMQGVRDAFYSKGIINHRPGKLNTYHLADTQKIMPKVVKTGQLQIIDSPNDPHLDAPVPSNQWKKKVAFFIPVKFENQTLAVLATGCPLDQKDNILNRINLLEPFLNHMAIALKHAQLHQEAKAHAQIQEMRLLTNQAVQQMTNKDDIHTVLHSCITEIRKKRPDINCLALHRIVDPQNHLIETYRVGKMGKFDNSPAHHANAQLIHRWQNDAKCLIVDLDEWEEQKIQDLRKKLNNLSLMSRLDIIVDTGIFALHSNQKNAFSDADKTFFRNIAEILSVGLKRVEDLEHLQAHQQRQDALLQINNAVQNMMQAKDLENVLHTVYQQLHRSQIQFSSLSIHHILDENLCIMKTFRISTAGTFIGGISSNPGAVSDWKKNKIIYRPNVEKDPQGLPQNYAQTIYKNQGYHVRSMLNLPLSKGMLVLRSEQIAAFSQQDMRLIEEIATILSLGIARADDLAQTEAQFQNLRQTLSDVPIGIILADPDSVIIQSNQASLDLLGLTEDQLVGKKALDPHWNVIHEDGSIFEPKDFPIPTAIRTKQSVSNIYMGVYRPKTKDRVHLLVNAAVQKDEADQVKRVVCSFMDISKLRQTTQALQQSQDLLSQAQSMARLGSWTLDPQTNQVHLSNELCKIYGIDTSESITTFDRTLEIVHPDDRQMIIDNARKFIETGIAENNEFRIIRANGDLAYLFGQAQVVTNSDGQVISLMGTVQDITERKQMESDNQRSQRLRALGEMAAGLSHNLNNILTGILGPAQLLLRTTQSSTNQEEIETILNAGLRARDIVNRLSKSWRADTETLEATHIQSVIQEAIKASQPRWKDEPESRGVSIDIHQHFEKIAPVCGTHTGLFDIIVNLIFNAVDAMPAGGHIAFTTTQTPTHVRLLVSDTGFGMSEDTLERIFDPFFTTKKDIGTGLGLSTVYGTINRWGGAIDVTSTPRQGTTFTLDFRIWEDNIVTPSNEVAPNATNKVGRILLVDDEEIVARVLQRALSTHHLEVVHSSQSALKIFEPNKYDILITDLGLPNLPGDQLAQQLRQTDPNLITILISGWDLLPSDPRRAQFDFFVQKPFDDFEAFEQIIAKSLNPPTS